MSFSIKSNLFVLWLGFLCDNLDVFCVFFLVVVVANAVDCLQKLVFDLSCVVKDIKS